MARTGEFHEWGSIIANEIRVIRPFVVFVFKNKRGWPKANLSIYSQHRLSEYHWRRGLNYSDGRPRNARFRLL
jgi:hypothetical protein